MLSKTVIRAADYLPEPEEAGACGSGDLESMQLPRSDLMLLNLFGGMPDYSDYQFEKLWQEVFDAEDKETIAWCLEKGVDVLTGKAGPDENDEPVPGWRDIVVMLKAIDAGLLKLNK